MEELRRPRICRHGDDRCLGLDLFNLIDLQDQILLSYWIWCHLCVALVVLLCRKDISELAKHLE